MKKILIILLVLPFFGFSQDDCGEKPIDQSNKFGNNYKQSKTYKTYAKNLSIWEECMALNGKPQLPDNCDFLQPFESVFDTSSVVLDMRDKRLYTKIGIPILYNSTYIYMRFVFQDGNQYLRIRTSTPRAGNIVVGNKLLFLLENNEKIELECDIATEQEVDETLVVTEHGGRTFTLYESQAYYFISKRQLELFSQSPIFAFKLSTQRSSFESKKIKGKWSNKIQDDAICMNIATKDIDFVNKRRKGKRKANGEWMGNGSGIIISKSGHIITNHHVIEDSEDIEVEFIINDEVRKFNAEILQSDKTNDLALIKIVDVNFDGVKTLPYNFKTRTSDVGTQIYTFGYPRALTVMGKEIKVTDGIISSKSGYDGDITTYQISAPIQPGNSGGPLFDNKGNFIGINSAIMKREIAENVGYSIKTSYVAQLIDMLPKSIELPSNKKLASLPLTEQIKEISKYVVLIKVK